MNTYLYENIFYPFVCIKGTKVSFKFSANVMKLAFMEIKQTLHGLALQQFQLIWIKVTYCGTISYLIAHRLFSFISHCHYNRHYLLSKTIIKAPLIVFYGDTTWNSIKFQGMRYNEYIMATSDQKSLFPQFSAKLIVTLYLFSRKLLFLSVTKLDRATSDNYCIRNSLEHVREMFQPISLLFCRSFVPIT